LGYGSGRGTEYFYAEKESAKKERGGEGERSFLYSVFSGYVPDLTLEQGRLKA